MIKKSTANKIKKMIYPLAFILIIIMSALYKLVLKGNGEFSVQAFKSKKTVQIEESGTDIRESNESGTGITSDTAASGETSLAIQMISVYICGEVNNPGIYEVPKGVILNKIIEAAGGFTEEASENNVNLVYQIESNMSIYIPSEDEITQGFTGGDIIRQEGVYVWGAQSGASGGTDQSATLMVNINTATEEELKSLPGIGDVTAKAIVNYRKDTPFKTIDDIKNVTGIGDSKFKQIKDYICV
ncbi:MAG: helix-hairpin-helix domain-containing protein [Clostridiales bacterium]|nr:helix-hairpin-helix domain-containing protein [Clostridiales bacterium]